MHKWKKYCENMNKQNYFIQVSIWLVKFTQNPNQTQKVRFKNVLIYMHGIQIVTPLYMTDQNSSICICTMKLQYFFLCVHPCCLLLFLNVVYLLCRHAILQRNICVIICSIVPLLTLGRYKIIFSYFLNSANFFSIIRYNGSSTGLAKFTKE